MASSASDEARNGRQEGSPQRRESRGPIVVCIDALDRHLDGLLQHGAVLARGLDREWFGLYVDTGAGSTGGRPSAGEEELERFLRRVRDLGGTAFTYRADDSVEAILGFVRERGAALLVVERPSRRSWWHRWLLPDDTVSRLIREARGVAVVVVDLGPEDRPVARVADMRSVDGLPPPVGEPPGLLDLLRAGTVGIYDAPMHEDQVVSDLINRLDARYAGLRLDRLGPVLIHEAKGRRTAVARDAILLEASLEDPGRPLAALGLLRTSHDRGRATAIILLVLLAPAGASDSVDVARRACLDLLEDREARRRLQARVTAESVLELVAALEDAPAARR